MKNLTVDVQRRKKIKNFLGIAIGALLVKFVGIDFLGKHLKKVTGGNTADMTREKVRHLARQTQERKADIIVAYRDKLLTLRKQRVQENYALASKRALAKASSDDAARLKELAQAWHNEDIEIRRKRELEELELAKARQSEIAELKQEYRRTKKLIQNRKV